MYQTRKTSLLEIYLRISSIGSVLIFISPAMLDIILDIYLPPSNFLNLLFANIYGF